MRLTPLPSRVHYLLPLAISFVHGYSARALPTLPVTQLCPQVQTLEGSLGAEQTTCAQLRSEVESLSAQVSQCIQSSFLLCGM